MMGAPAIVELRDVTVLLGGARRWLRAAVPPVRAVGGVSLTVQPGEIIGLIGESALLPKAARRRRIMYLGRIVEVARADQLFAAPRHPYTRALLDAAPRVDPSAASPAALQGEPPSAARLPPGCVFSSRCQHAEPSCREAEPVLQDDAGHAVACPRWRDIGPAVGGRAKNPVLALA